VPNKKQFHGTDMNGYKVTGLPAPSAPSDAATKEWVEQNAGGSPQASNVTFTPDANTFPTEIDNVDEALKHLFTSANSGKSAIAGAIGSPTTSANTFAEMATAINDEKADIAAFINSAEGAAASTETLAALTGKLSDVRVFKQSAKLNKLQNSTSTFDLKQVNGSYPAKNKICVMPMIRVDDASTTLLGADFNNGNPQNFQQNDNVEFTGGVARPKIDYNKSLESTAVSGVKQVTIDLLNFRTFSITSLTSTTIDYRAIPIDPVLIASGSIPLQNVIDIESVSVAETSTSYPSFSPSYTFARLFVQCGESNPFYYFDSVAGWIAVDINNFASLSGLGTIDTLLNLENLQVLRNLPGNDPSKIRFAYALVTGVNLVTVIDNLNLNVVINGSFVPANETGSTSNPPTVDYNANDGKLTVTYKQAGYDSYIINYLDKP
jgi:hypothetical protein